MVFQRTDIGSGRRSLCTGSWEPERDALLAPRAVLTTGGQARRLRLAEHPQRELVKAAERSSPRYFNRRSPVAFVDAQFGGYLGAGLLALMVRGYGQAKTDSGACRQLSTVRSAGIS